MMLLRVAQLIGRKEKKEAPSNEKERERGKRKLHEKKGMNCFFYFFLCNK